MQRKMRNIRYYDEDINMRRERDIIIIGAGLAGTAAALEASRVGYNVLSLSKPKDPGYWARVKRLNNFPGIAENVSGAHIIEQTKKLAETNGAAFHDFEVTTIQSIESRAFRVADANNEYYEAPAIIIASGTSKDEHFLVGERELVGKGVFYSAQNDGPSLKHRSATIIGKSQEAVEAALYLSKFASKIYFVIPSSKLDVSDNIIKDLEATTKIELIFSSSIKTLNGNDELHSVTILSAGTERDLESKAAFIYTYSLLPCSGFAKDIVKVDEATGRILINSEFSTSRPGIFACGDVLTGTLQNPAISSSQGFIAAVNAEKYLNP